MKMTASPHCGAISSGGSLTAVILLVIVSSELETIVAAAHQVSSTPRMAIIDAAVQRSVTVTLAFTTGVFRCAASPPVIVPTPTSLVWPRLQWHPGTEDGGRSLRGQGLRQVTAVVFRMIIQAELTTVVAPAHEV